MGADEGSRSSIRELKRTRSKSSIGWLIAASLCDPDLLHDYTLSSDLFPGQQPSHARSWWCPSMAIRSCRQPASPSPASFYGRSRRIKLLRLFNWCSAPPHQVDAVVYLVDAYDKERFSESKKELDALLSDAASEDELRYHLGLANCTTGKGKVRPLEIFMCSIVRKMGYGEGFKWMSQYINPEED